MLLTRLTWIIICPRPDVVITTGAASGYFAVRIGKFFGARTLFLDSIANAERLSLSARMAGATSLTFSSMISRRSSALNSSSFGIDITLKPEST
jgi:hypothetical protein